MSQAMQASLAEAWYLKDIRFGGQHYRIITQNFNGCVRRLNSTCASNVTQFPTDPVHSSQYVSAFYLVFKIF